MIRRYAGIAPKGDLVLIGKLGEKLKGKSFLHINSTRAGGGVAEILQRMIPVLENLGVKARWEVLEGDERFFDITKKLHNTLQGQHQIVTEEMWDYHFEVNKRNAGKLDLEADAVLIHDPQPAALVEFRKTGKWIWRCHIDVSSPISDVWLNLERYCRKYDASVFSVAKFAKAMDIDEFIVAPSIDPLADKNRDLSAEEIRTLLAQFGIPEDRAMVLQVSRFDRFKDPLGVIKAYRSVKKYNDCILVLAGSPATDDPEGEEVLQEVRNYASDDPDIHILLLPAFSDLAINALQRAATVILQKSVKEGFGLTVSEAMWKGKPVIGGATGGIPLQIIHGVNGFLVHSVQGAAFRIRQLLNDRELGDAMGVKAREYVRTNFLITRQIRDYLSIWHYLETGRRNIMEL